jgi:hypothetical protein
VSVTLNIRIEFGVAPLKIGVGYDSRSSMSWTDDVHHVCPMHADEAIQVNVDEIQPGRCTKVSEEPWFDVLNCQGPFKQRIIFEVDSANGKVIGCAPVSGIFLSPSSDRALGIKKDAPFVSTSPCRLPAERLNSLRTQYLGAERLPSDVEHNLDLQEAKPRMRDGEPFHAFGII